MASTRFAGVATAGSKTTLARLAIRSTRADCTPAVERSAVFHVMLAGGAGHAQNRKGEGFAWRAWFTYVFQSRGEAGLGQRGNGLIDGRGVLGGAEPRRAHATSLTSSPSAEANAWLTRRTQEPQCMPSIRSVNSDMFVSRLHSMILRGKRCGRDGQEQLMTRRLRDDGRWEHYCRESLDAGGGLCRESFRSAAGGRGRGDCGGRAGCCWCGGEASR